MSRHLETDLLGQNRPCALCGVEAFHPFHFVTDHVHPPHDRNQFQLIRIEMNQICGCGHCCSCYEKQESVRNPIIRGVFQSVCRTCSVLPLKADCTYEYCLFCTRLTQCPRCQHNNDRSHLCFWQFETLRVACDHCGFKFRCRDQSLTGRDVVAPEEEEEEEERWARLVYDRVKWRREQDPAFFKSAESTE